MLTTIALILVVLWLLGVLGIYTVGWYIHILLIIAAILFLMRIVRGQNSMP